MSARNVEFVTWHTGREFGKTHLSVKNDDRAVMFCGAPAPRIGRISRTDDWGGPIDQLCRSCLKEYAKGSHD